MKTADSNLVGILRRLPLFSDLTTTELALIAGEVSVRRFGPHETIFSEGDPCPALLIVSAGRVNLLKTAASGRQQLLSVERAGNSLSEISALDEGPCAATAVTATDVVLLCLNSASFRGVCLEHPEMALKVIKALGHRLRRLGRLIEDLSFSTVRGRLLAHLAHLAREEGRRTPHGVEFARSENNEQLAVRLGTVRELVSRNLGRLHNEGLVQVSRRKILVPDLDLLEQEVARGR
jgi:CRP/FNR family transcriptional regulator